MSQGRCAGCQVVGKPRAMRVHVLDCPQWQALPPACQLDPVAEYARWQSGDQGREKQAARSMVVTANADRKQDQDSRFARLPDPDL